MDKLFEIEETEDSPGVLFDMKKNIFELTGKSLPEDPFEFYAPLHQWINEYVKMPNSITEFVIKLEYFNSASARHIVDLLNKLIQIQKSGREIKVVWYYNKEDEFMEERVDEIKSAVDLPFEIKTY